MIVNVNTPVMLNLCLQRAVVQSVSCSLAFNPVAFVTNFRLLIKPNVLLISISFSLLCIVKSVEPDATSSV